MARVLVEYSKRLQQAVDASLGTPELSVHTTRRERGRSALSDMSDAVSSEYNGYFKVIDASETAEDGTKTWKVKVVDGTGHVSFVNSCGFAIVNEKTYPVDNAEIEIPAKNNVLKNYYLYLKSQPISSSYTTPEFELLDDIKLEMEQDVGRTLIAMIYFHNALEIFQVSTGIPRILIWGKCEDENVQ